MVDLRVCRDEIAAVAERPCAYPAERFSGAGIVICAGGRTYFTCAWVLVRLLRSLGCRLPIEVWHRGRVEMSPRMQSVLESVEGVRCMDASEVRKLHPVARLDGWELKPYAVLHSRFEEAIFIDCDNVPVRDPSFLLRSQAYRRLGAMFWPDRWMGEGDPEGFRTIRDEAWDTCGVPRRDEPEFETGQMVVDKRRCWKALQLTMLLNERSDVFYRLMLGDKDTFHMAWRRLGQDYAMPRFRPEQDGDDGPVLYQRDPQGRLLFQHRNHDKWDYDGGNRRIPGFEHEAFCLEQVAKLRRRWDGVVRAYPDDYTPAERETYEALTAERLFRYGSASDSRLIELRPDFQIGIGKGLWETGWEIGEAERGLVQLTIRCKTRRMCTLTADGDARWAGQRLHFERKPARVEPITRLAGDERKTAEQLRQMLSFLPDQDTPEAEQVRATRSYLYHRVGHGSRLMEFHGDQTIRRGGAGCERWWYLDERRGRPRLVIGGDCGPICQLARKLDGAWQGQWSQFERMPVELIPRPGAFAYGSAGPGGYY